MRFTITLSAVLPAVLWTATASSQTPEWTLEPTHAIGSFDGEETAFQYVSRVFTGPHGQIFVVDTDGPRIAIFDSTGTFLHDVGREGRGPAEFRLIQSAGLTADTLWAFDAPQAKIVWFGPDGSFLRTSRVPDGPAAPLAVSPGRVLGVGIPSLATDSAYVVSATGERVDSLIAVHRPSARMRIDIGTVNASLVHEFHDGELVAVSADGDVIHVVQRPIAEAAAQAEFRVTRFSATGEPMWTRAYRYEPLAVADDHIEAVVREIMWRFTQLPMLRGQDAAVRRAVMDALPIPRFAPPVWSAVAADDGSLWLERTRGSDGSRWIVLNPDGDPVGRAGLPAAMNLSSVRGTRACGIDQTGADFPRILCYRVAR